jgi:parallel beta-helix repeat protein
MRTTSRTFMLGAAIALVMGACGTGDGGRGTTRFTAAQAGEVQAALIAAQPGDELVFASGRYMFSEELSLSVNDVTLRGEGDGVIFDFSGQAAGNANGISATGVSDVTFENFSVVDTRGDGIKVTNGTNLTFRKIKVSWSRGPDPMNGGYGLYPVLSNKILIDDCEVKYASDAGIYVGQSTYAIVRNSRAEGNVAGIEIENTDDAEVAGNTAHDNTVGLLVFNLPNLQRKSGSRTMVRDNTITSNNQMNYAAAGNVLSYVPPGVGMILFAHDSAEVTGNTIMGNESTAMVISSCPTFALLSDGAVNCADAAYDSYAEGLYVHDNTFSGNGTEPSGFFQIFWAPVRPAPLHDILWDGQVAAGRPDNGELCIRNNGPATYVRLDITTLSLASTDLSAHDCTRPGLPALEVTW